MSLLFLNSGFIMGGPDARVHSEGAGRGAQGRIREAWWTVASNVTADGRLADSFHVLLRSLDHGRNPDPQKHSGYM